MNRVVCSALAALIAAGAAAQASAQMLGWTDVSGPPTCTIVKRGLGGKIFAATNTLHPDFTVSYDGKLLYSVDSGRSWHPTTLAYGSITDVVVHGARIIVSREIQSPAPYQAVLSSDEGMTWKGIFSSFFSQITAFMISASGTIYGIALNTPVGPSDYTLVRYTGTRWFAVGSSIRFYGDYVTTAATDSCGNFYFGTDEDGLFVSTDTGTTWRQTLPARKISYLQAGRCGDLLVGITPNPVVTGGVFTSTDTGHTWTLLGLAHNRVTSVAADDGGSVYASTDAGAYRYLGTPLEWQAEGPVNDLLDDLAASAPGVLVAVSASEGIFRSSDGGTTWNKSDVRGQDVSAVTTIGTGTILAGTYGKGIFVSTDAGGIWSQAEADSSAGEYVYAFARAGPGIFAATEEGLVRSTDGGLSWTNVTRGAFTGGVFSVTADSAGRVFAGANFGIYRSDDQGAHWELALVTGGPVTALGGDGHGILLCSTAASGSYRSTDGGFGWSTLPFARDDVLDCAVTPEGRLLFGVNGGVEVSDDGGMTWSLKGFASTPVYALARVGSYIAAGSGEGLFLSADNGESWQTESTGIYETKVLSVAATETGALLAGTYHGGLYRSLQTLTAAEGAPPIPSAARLLPAYPNPFNPRTTIRYELAQHGRMRLAVYDLLGREVALLRDGEGAPGVYEVAWDASGFPSGVYFGRLLAGGSISVQTFVLTR